MKTLNTLLVLLLLALFSCENNNSNSKNSADLSDDQVISLAESFDQDEESLTDDMDDAFSSYDAKFKLSDSDARFKDDTRATYDSTTGYWTKSHNIDKNRVDSIRRNEHLVVKNMSLSIQKTTKIRFSDAENTSIQHPKENKDAIKKIEMERNGLFESNGSVSVYDSQGNLLGESRERSGHKDANGKAVLEKKAGDNTLWTLNGSGEKSISFSSTKNGETKEFEKVVNVVMENLEVKHSKEKKRRVFKKNVRAQIVSGKITRTIENVEGSTIVVVTTYYDCEVEADKKRLTRTITKDGVLVKEVTVYCERSGE